MTLATGCMAYLHRFMFSHCFHSATTEHDNRSANLPFIFAFLWTNCRMPWHGGTTMRNIMGMMNCMHDSNTSSSYVHFMCTLLPSPLIAHISIYFRSEGSRMPRTTKVPPLCCTWFNSQISCSFQIHIFICLPVCLSVSVELNHLSSFTNHQQYQTKTDTATTNSKTHVAWHINWNIWCNKYLSRFVQFYLRFFCVRQPHYGSMFSYFPQSWQINYYKMYDGYDP